MMYVDDDHSHLARVVAKEPWYREPEVDEDEAEGGRVHPRG